MEEFIVNPKMVKSKYSWKGGKKVINQYINNMEGSGPRLAFMTLGDLLIEVENLLTLS